MMAEHILYTLAIVIIIGIYFNRLTNRQYHWWILVLVSFIPDIDHLHHFPFYLNLTHVDSHINNIAPWIEIGDMHNIFWLLITTLIIAGILTKVKIPFYEGAMYCMAGYGIHLIEDFVSYPPVYTMLYPVWKYPVGINLIPETNNLGIAGTEVLNVGIILLVLSIFWYSINYYHSLSILKSD